MELTHLVARSRRVWKHFKEAPSRVGHRAVTVALRVPRCRLQRRALFHFSVPEPEKNKALYTKMQYPLLTEQRKQKPATECPRVFERRVQKARNKRDSVVRWRTVQSGGGEPSSYISLPFLPTLTWLLCLLRVRCSYVGRSSIWG